MWVNTKCEKDVWQITFYQTGQDWVSGRSQYDLSHMHVQPQNKLISFKRYGQIEFLLRTQQININENINWHQWYEQLA